MRVALTGTPGTGKTTVADALETELSVLPLGPVVREEGLVAGRDEERDTLVADVAALRDRFADRTDVVFESHLAHRLPVDRAVVLRCHPEELERRLGDRGWADEKVTENAEAEALDVVLSEAVATQGRDAVYEIDTTDRSPAAVAGDVDAVIRGERAPRAGQVSFIEYL